MEGLAALSVAGAVVQFVDFGGKLLSNSRKLYRSADGVLTEHVDLKLISTDLSTLLQSLERQLPENRPMALANETDDQSQDDEAMDELCKRCVDIAKDLISRIDKLKLEPHDGKLMEDSKTCEEIQARGLSPLEDTPRETRAAHEKSSTSSRQAWVAMLKPKGLHSEGYFKRWNSFRKALEASWNKRDIEALASTLRAFRAELEFHILVKFQTTLKNVVFQQSQLSTQLTQSTRVILESFIHTRDDLANQIRLQTERLIKSQGCNGTKSQVEIDEILKGPMRLTGTLQSPRGAKQVEDTIQEPLAHNHEVEEQLRLLMIENGILLSLTFTTLMDRKDSLETPHQQTFQWIFEEPGTTERPWSSFSSWLRYNSGFYWISGKAGSGKSTLMRHVYDNPRTLEHLKEWSDPMPIDIGGFFFWNSGDENQKSQSGLLRSLLFELLQRHRDLLPELMPEIWDIWSTRASVAIGSRLAQDSPFIPPKPGAWKMVQLKRIFRDLLRILQAKVKLCLFIDGLDEFDGDYLELLNLFQEYSRSPNIKICFSSRPLLVLESEFAGAPTLRLQYLTYGDISHYVKDKLYRHKYMAELSKRRAAEVSLLVDEIVTKAQGVFLWVKLVVRSLLRGLSDHNRISDLQRRVEHLPEDLEALYFHMIRSTDPFYHEQASRIFQIVRAAQRHSPGKLTLLQLSFADDDKDGLAESAKIGPLSDEDILDRCEETDARLKSVCAGLLESSDMQFSEIAPDAKVAFLHRTVSDWLEQPLVWDQIIFHTINTKFSPNLSMLRSSVMQLKTAIVSPTLPLDMSIITSGLCFAQESELDLSTGFPKLLDQLDIAASYQWRMGKAQVADELPSDTFSVSFEGSIPSSSARSQHNSSEYFNSQPQDLFCESDQTDFSRASPSLIPKHKLQHLSLILSQPDFQNSSVPAVSSDKGILYHWTYGIDLPGIKPIGVGSTFYDIAKALGLKHYVSMKHQAGDIVDQDVNQHLLLYTVSESSNPDAVFIERVLNSGVDPNFTFKGPSPWEHVLLSAATHFDKARFARFKDRMDNSDTMEWKEVARNWTYVIRMFINHGADPAFLTGRHPKIYGHPRLSLSIILEQFFPGFLETELIELRKMLEKKELVARGETCKWHDEESKAVETSKPSRTTWASMIQWIAFW